MIGCDENQLKDSKNNFASYAESTVISVWLICYW